MSATNIEMITVPDALGFRYGGKTYIFSNYPKNGIVSGVNDSGLVYAVEGKISRAIDMKRDDRDPRKYMYWDSGANSHNMVTVTYTVPIDSKNPTGSVAWTGIQVKI